MNLLTDDQLTTLKARLTRTEGRRNRPYVDTRGFTTIGIGHNLSAKGVPDELVDIWFNEDIAEAVQGANSLPAYNQLDPVRQTVLVDMIFNMGLDKVREFVNTLAYLSKGQWDMAAEQMLASAWAKQVGSRATELARIIKSGHI